jgi:hypothetical protein
MKLKDIKPGQTFQVVNNELMKGHRFLCLHDGDAVNLTTLKATNLKFGLGDTEIELVENETNVYHACRQAFVCGQERVPWHLVVHALREGLNMEKFKTYNLTEENYKEYSQLRELVSWLKLSLSASNADNTKSQ